MAGRNLLDVPMLELIPQCMRQDPTVIVFCEVADVMLALVHSQIRNVLIWPHIDELEEPVLSVLAYQMHIEGYEGWHLAETLDQKRSLIKDAYKMHFYKGTRWSLERIFDLLDLPGDVTEWWEAPAPDFPPYTFDMDIHVPIDRRISRMFYSDAMGLIDALKNVRSHLRYGTVHVETSPSPVYFGGGVIAYATVHVQPIIPTKVIIRDRMPFIAFGLPATYQTVNVQPLVPKQVTIRDKMPFVAVGMVASQTMTVTPCELSGVRIKDNALPVATAIMTEATMRVAPVTTTTEDTAM